MEGVGGLSTHFSFEVPELLLDSTEECLGGGGGISCAEGVLTKLGLRPPLRASCVGKLVAKPFSTLNLAPDDEPEVEDSASASSDAALLLRPGGRCLSAAFLAYRAMRLQTKQD